MRWLHLWWWRYLLAPKCHWEQSWPVVIWCRMRGHPNGVVWYNPSGWEPDMHCKTCGDDIG